MMKKLQNLSLGKVMSVYGIFVLLTFPGIAMAAGEGPGQALWKLIQDQVGPLFFVGCAIAALVYFFQKQFTRFISFAIFALFVAAFIWTPEVIKNMGVNLVNRLFGGWLQ